MSLRVTISTSHWGLWECGLRTGALPMKKLYYVSLVSVFYEDQRTFYQLPFGWKIFSFLVVLSILWKKSSQRLPQRLWTLSFPESSVMSFDIYMFVYVCNRSQGSRLEKQLSPSSSERSTGTLDGNKCNVRKEIRYWGKKWIYLQRIERLQCIWSTLCQFSTSV